MKNGEYWAKRFKALEDKMSPGLTTSSFKVVVK